MTDTAVDVAEEPSKQEVDARLAAAAGKPVWVKLAQLPADAVTFVTQAMVRASAGCRKCRGRGHTGHLAKDQYNPLLRRKVAAGAAIPCSCLVVDATAVRAAIAAEEVRLTQLAHEQEEARLAKLTEDQAATPAAADAGADDGREP